MIAWNVILWTATVVVWICILLGRYPEILLKIPEIGFLPYTIVTGQSPPNFISFECFKDFETWTRPGDIIISAQPKSGGSLLSFTSHLIRARGNLDKYPYRDVNFHTPWVSLIHRPGQTWSELKSLMNSTVLEDGSNLVDLWNRKDFPFRVFKSRESPTDENDPIHSGVLPVKSFPNVKFVAMVRDLPDVLYSYFPFTQQYQNSFRSIWGGQPPQFSEKKEKLMYLLNPKNGIDVKYAKAWWKIKDYPNVLLLHYSDAVKSPRKFISKLATFYGVSLSQQEIDKIEKLTTFSAIKSIEQSFDTKLWGNKFNENGEGVVFKRGTIFSSGKIGESAPFFKEEGMKTLREYEENILKGFPELLSWTRNGGNTK